MGLSFLQTYTDEEEQEREVVKDEEDNNKKSIDSNNEKVLDKLGSQKSKENTIKNKPREKQQPKADAEVEKKKGNLKKKGKTKKYKRKEKKRHKLKKTKKHKKKKVKSVKKEASKKEEKAKHSLADKDNAKNVSNKKVEKNKVNKNEIHNDTESKKSKNVSNIKKPKVQDSKKDDKNKTKNKKRSSSNDDADKEEQKDVEPDINKSDNLIKKESRSKTPIKGKKDDSKQSSKKNKVEEKSDASEKKPKNHESVSPKKEREVITVKCVAEKEFGTPDTDEYYSNWESDVDIAADLIKHPSESLNQSSSLNQSWQSEDEPLETSDLTILDDIPLAKSPFRNHNSPFEHLNREDKWVHKRNTSRRSSLQDKLLSPTRRLSDSARSRHLDNFPLDISPKLNDVSPLRRNLSPIEFSPFTNRCLDERRRPMRSIISSRSPPEKFPEMPLNIRNTRNTYSRAKWEEERFNTNNKYNRSPDRINESKIYSLYAENTWERDDYITIKTEEMRLEEERRTLIEERRKLEIERRQLEELERQRYYSRMSEYNDDRRSFDDRRQDHFKSSDDENNRYVIKNCNN